jgi:hypothetical protein
MATERRRHLKAEVGLSETARGIIRSAFETGSKSYEEIAQEILLTTGEKIGRSSIARAWREWRVQQRAREAREVALAQLADLHKLPSDKLDEVIEQLLRTNAYESLAQAEAGEIDPGKAILALERKRRGRLMEREVAVRERLVAIKEQVRAADSQVAAMAASGELPADVAQRIRMMYGLKTAS